MSSAILVGAVVAYPFNVWLVANGLKHGMGTANVLGRGGSSEHAHEHHAPPSRSSVTAATASGLIVLALGLAVAVRFGDL